MARIDLTQVDLTRLIPFCVFAVSVFALGNAYTAQYAFGLEPCILCLYQRVPYAVAGTLGVVAFLLPRNKTDWKGHAVALSGGVFLIGAGIAFYHVGVEQHWWASVAACGASGGGPGDVGEPQTVDQLRQMLMQAKPVKACDEVDWTLFGLSMATYNVPFSLALALASLWGVKHLRRMR